MDEDEIKFEKVFTDVDGEFVFIPELFLQRIRALMHGERLDEALRGATNALAQCDGSMLRLKAQFLYLRGKVDIVSPTHMLLNTGNAP